MTGRKRADLQLDVTPRERAHTAVDGRFEDIDLDFLRRVRSVQEAPAEYLSFLAGERSVDVYDPAWLEPVRRAVIQAAPSVHRRKGTLPAVRKALDALGIRSEVVPWYAPGGTGVPYTFSVTAFVQGRLYDGPLLDARTVRAAYATVLAAKPLSRAFKFSIAASFPAVLGFAPVLLAESKVRVAMRPHSRERFTGGLGLAPVALARVRVAVSMIAKVSPP